MVRIDHSTSGSISLVSSHKGSAPQATCMAASRKPISCMKASLKRWRSNSSLNSPACTGNVQTGNQSASASTPRAAAAAGGGHKALNRSIEVNERMCKVCMALGGQRAWRSITPRRHPGARAAS